MYSNTSTEFNSKIAGDGRTFKAKLVIGKNEITDGFISIKTKVTSTSENLLQIGSAVAAQLDITMMQPDIPITGAEMQLFIGLKMNEETIEYVPIGYFTPQKPTIENGQITFTAYDRMISKLEGAYFSELSYPTDISNVLNEIKSKSGIEIAGSYSGIQINQRAVAGEAEYDEEGNETTTTTYVNPFDGYTYREAVAILAGLLGKFATINRNGKLEFRWYSAVDYVVGTDASYDDIISAETTFSVDYVHCNVEDKELQSGNGLTGIDTNNPLMTKERLDSIYNELHEFSYKATTCSYKGDVRLDLGDIVTVVNCKGEEIVTPVMSIELDYDGGLVTYIGSYAATNESSNDQQGPIAKELERQYTKLLLVKELLVNKITADVAELKDATVQDLKAVNASINSLVAIAITTNNIQAQLAKIGALTVETADAKYATINLANVQKADIGTLLADIGLITSATIENGHVTGYLDSVKVDANAIKTGILSCDRLIINGTDKSIVYYLNNMGQLTSKSVDSIDGGVLTSRTVTADKIVAKAITANEINVANLLVSGFVGTNKLTAKNITVADLSAISAKIAGLTLSDSAIYSGTNSMASTIPGFYLGKDGLKQYENDKQYIELKSGKLKTFGAEIQGKIEAESGNIAGWTISKDFLRKEVTIDGIKYQMCVQAPNGNTTTNFLYVRHSGDDGKTWTYDYQVNYQGEVTANNIKIMPLLNSGGSYTYISLRDGYMQVTNNGTGVSLNINVDELGNPCINFNNDSGFTKITRDEIYAPDIKADTLNTTGHIYVAHNKALRTMDASKNDTMIAAIDGNNKACLFTDFKGDTYLGNATNKTTQIRGGHVLIYSKGTNAVRIFKDTDGRFIMRSEDNGKALGGYLGTSGFKWNTAFFTNTITQSDRKTKTDLTELDNAAEFIMSLKPYAYHLTNSDSGEKRWHMGLVAQDVAEISKKVSVSTKDEIHNLSLYQASIIHEDGTENYYKGQEIDDSKLSWGLNYNELIAPLVATIQEQQRVINKQTETINRILKRLEALEREAV